MLRKLQVTRIKPYKVIIASDSAYTPHRDSSKHSVSSKDSKTNFAVFFS
jgi:hypothetical protein